MSRHYGVPMRDFDDDQTTVMLTPMVIVTLLLAGLLVLILAPLWIPVLALLSLVRLVRGYLAGVIWASRARSDIARLYAYHYMERRLVSSARWPEGFPND